MRLIGQFFPDFFGQSLKEALGFVHVRFLLATVLATAAAGPVNFARPPLGNALHLSLEPNLGNCLDYQIDLIACVLRLFVLFEL